MRLRLTLLFGFGALGLFAESGTPAIRTSGVPADGGQNCGSCHNSPPPGVPGSLTIDATDYNPGVMQTIHVTITDRTAARWGFQLTARIVSDETKPAGTLSPVDGLVQVRCDDGSAKGSPGPCSGTREFAGHVLAPTTSFGAGFTFDVNWMPPPNEVGDVRLYAAAVAANNDGTPAGDRVYTTVRTLSSVGACNFTKRPTLRTAVNAASFLPAFSSNAMMTIFGADFQVPGRSRQAGAGDFVNQMFPTQLACVAVEMNGVRVPVAYVQQDQINIQAPVFSSSGPVSLIVILNPGKPNEIRSDMATLNPPQSFAPAFFTLGATNSIAAQFANSPTVVADPALVPGAHPAKPGDIITLYATGLGATNPSVATGQLDPGIAPVTSPVSVTIGGITLPAADVPYAGLSPQSISGLYQINVRLPATLPNGDAPVVITIGGQQSQPGATIPIAAP